MVNYKLLIRCGNLLSLADSTPRLGREGIVSHTIVPPLIHPTFKNKIVCIPNVTVSSTFDIGVGIKDVELT